MRIALAFCVFLATFGGELHADRPPPEVPSADLKHRLLSLCADQSLGYHLLLHDASHEVRRVALDRPWSEVEPLLKGMKMELNYKLQYTTTYRYVCGREAWRAADKSPHSLYLEFTVDNRPAGTAPNAKPGFVMDVKTGLSAEPNIPYAEVLRNEPYPRDTVVFQGLRLPQVVDAAKNYPILKKVEVTYDLLHDHNLPTVPQGFELTLEFGESLKDDRRGCKLYFTVESNLDAIQDWKGHVVSESFKPKDTLGEFQDRGSEEWK